jgi:hypothetical protein
MFENSESLNMAKDLNLERKHVNFNLNEMKSTTDENNYTRTSTPKNIPTSLEKENRKVKIEKLKKRFVQWSILTKFDCYSKIFMYENLTARIVWFILFVIFVSLTVWLATFNIINFFKYELTSKIDTKSERPTSFPAITICNNDPFTTLFAQALMHNISIENFGKDIENMTIFDAFSQSRYITELTKMFVSSPSFDKKRTKLGKKLHSLIISCSFNNKACTNTFIDSFTRTYFSYDYGNCLQFNTGFNDSGSTFELNKVDTEGKQHGFSIVFGPLYNSNKYLSSHADGLIVYIHNQSVLPSKFATVDIGKETNIVVGRTFKTMQEKPYSECQDANSINSEIVNLNKQKHKKYVYRQRDCFDLCLQRLIVKSCGCYFTKYSNIYDTSPCLNLTELECIYKQQGIFQEENCVNDCPLECSSMYYDYSLSSLSFPNQKFVDLLKSDGTFLNEIQMNHNVSLSNLESFQKYFLSLNIFYSNLEYTEITEKPTFTPIDLLSQIGGSLGMFLGFSLFHFIELIEIFFIIFYTSILNFRKKYELYQF